MTNPTPTVQDTPAEEFHQRGLKGITSGTSGFDYVGRRKTWYSLTAAVVLISLVAIVLRGFSFGIDFTGGTKFNLPASLGEEQQVVQIIEDATGAGVTGSQVVGAGEGRILEVSMQLLTDDQIDEARTALLNELQPTTDDGQLDRGAIGDSTVSESWGGTITQRMLLALGAFLVIIFGYITIRFERDMAIAAIGALMFDMVVTSGIYALVGFEVTPATVIGLLTILAFSLYDTVVVFDKVQETTAGTLHTTRRTYAENANEAINQTVMRSINTTVISVLPIAALMVVAVWLLGVGTLKDLALVQLIGVIVGTCSSIFLATPLLVSIKQRQKRYREHNRAVAIARGEITPATPAADTETTGITVTATAVEDSPEPTLPQAETPQPAKPVQAPRPQGKRRT